MTAPTSPLGFTQAQLQAMLQNLHLFTQEEVEEINRLLDELDRREQLEAARNDLLAFCQHMQPDYKIGAHHRALARLLMEIERGEKDRIAVSMPPRHGKSALVSTYYAAWFMGRNPDKKLMLVSHTTDLAVDFGRKVRNVIAEPAYRELFPDCVLAVDSKSAGRWNTTRGGEFYAAGVGSSIAGRGADLLVVDDPHSEQDVLAGNFEAFTKAYEWFTFGARTRLMPGGRVAVVHTRWHTEDLIGRLTRDMAQIEGADQYEIVEFPAILEVQEEDPDAEPAEDGTPTTRTVQKALWPEFFDLQALLRTKASMPAFQWNAQYQQNPTAEGAALVKRDWWRDWAQDDPPECEYLIMTLDAAAEAKQRADYSAITVWGVFFNENENAHHVILLNAVRDRVEFPELKQLALEVYRDFQPDSFIVEKKSSGTALYQELRRMGLPVSEYTPVRGSANNPNTKYARLNSVADIVKSGLVWVPRKRWAEELVEEVAGFPAAPNDDLVDCMIMALMRFRQGGFVRLPSDDMDDELPFERPVEYY